MASESELFIDLTRGPPMARRRQESILETLSTLPWWVSVLVAGIVYVFLKWVIVSVVGPNPVLKALAQGLQGNAGLFAAIFLLAAPVAAFNSFRRRKLLDRQNGLGSIRAMSWQEFELLVGEAFRRQGYEVEERGGIAPDGGIDLLLYKNGKKTVVQCKRWKNSRVGATLVRELFGVMTAEQADSCIFVSSGTYSPDARTFAGGKPIQLIDGYALSKLVASVQSGQPAAPPIRKPTNALPLCPSCGNQMVRRVAKRGSEAGQPFWGCSQFPRCREIRPV
jgi:restriction system protein